MMYLSEVPSEVCAGEEGCTSQVMKGCRCRLPIVFLCIGCLNTHINRNPSRRHWILNYYIAKRIHEDLEFAIDYYRFSMSKTQIQKKLQECIKMLKDSKGEILTFKQKIIEDIDAGIQAHLVKKDELINYMHGKLQDSCNLTVDLLYEDHDIIDNYLDKVIEDIEHIGVPRLDLNYYEIKKAIQENIKVWIDPAEEVENPNYDLHVEEVKEIVEVEAVELENPNYDSSSCILYPKNGTKELVKYDADRDSVTKYELSNHITHKFYCSASCILPGGNILIAGGLSRNGNLIGDTYKIDVSKNRIQSTKLGNLNTPRICDKVICYEGYIYIFGGSLGYGYHRKAERMEVNESNWTTLPDMKEKRNDMGVYAEGNRIYIIGGHLNKSIEYYDILLNTFTLLPDIQVPIYGAMVGVIEDKIYCIGYNHLRVFSKDFQLFESKDNINNHYHFSYSNVIVKDAQLLYVNHINSSLNIFDAATKTMTLLKIL